MHDRAAYLDELVQQAHPDGGWGYTPTQPAQPEPTCLALLALSLQPEKYAEPLRRAQNVLDRCAGSDGAYRLAKGRDEAVWPTALVLFVQSALAYPQEEIRRTTARLLALRGRVPDQAQLDDIQDIDLTLVGWPWAEKNFSWVEPTAWACLALRRAGQGEHPRVKEGLRLLLDRALDEGGINYGNRRILGRFTEPLPGTTALMLLAFQDTSVQPRIAAAVDYLARQADTTDLEHLCWIKLALDLYRIQPGVTDLLPELDRRIKSAHRARPEVNWTRPAPVRQALTALALATEQRNAFRLPAPQARPSTVSEENDGEKSPGLILSISNFFHSSVPRFFRGLAIKAAGQLRQTAPKTSVHIARAANYQANLADVLVRQYEHFKERVPLAGKRVVLKPNLVEYHKDKVINTNPKIIAAAIELCRHAGAAEVIVAEGPGHCRNVEYIVAESGLGDVLKHYQVPFVDLNHDEPIKTPNLGRLTGLEYLFLARTVMTADVLISMPKLKTHHWAGATLSLKNLFGTLPGICYGWPKNELHWRGIDNSIVDIALTRTPDLAIVDGIIGMEGDGPLNGTAKEFGALIMGTDLLAVDATCCRLMQLVPEKIPYLILGQARKLGLLLEKDIEQIGEPIAALAQPFATVEHMRSICLGKSA
jgi:uncharacterized protein (DUF362 family)